MPSLAYWRCENGMLRCRRMGNDWNEGPAVVNEGLALNLLQAE